MINSLYSILFNFILNTRLLFFIFIVVNAVNDSDKCINILNSWDLRQGIENKCPDWVVNVCWIIYDVKDGEGFNLQRNVFDRMALVVSRLNEIIYKKNEDKFAVLILPPFCNIAHWTYNSKRRLPWSTFFNIKQNGLPTLEYDIYQRFTGIANLGAEVVGLNFDWNNKSFQSSTSIEYYNNFEISESRHLSSKCLFNNYVRNGNVVYGGRCELIKIKSLICLSFFKLMRFKEVSEEIYKILESNRREGKLHNYLIKHAEGILVPWPWELSKYRVLDVISYNNNIRKYANLYMSANTFFDGKKPYISVHLRRNDFVFLRNDDIPTFDQVIDRLLQLSNDLKTKRVVISTDANEYEKNELSNIFLKHNLDLHIISIKDHLDDGIVSAVSQVILLNGEYFIGTKESRFSHSVIWDCILSIMNDFKNDVSGNFNKCNEVFCGKANEKNSICREHPDRLPNFKIDVA
ncbi:GDP-fucose protein O-fucosyltransferase family protein [Cryptosporidium meleagridis]|uniref:GDP-fucose protein O-fucosyltransferase 2 n=1 Tax=Cryptosporidium meleagridis TaxID=93969 RepID=A0A2P4YWH7_9CRYT|nr:GDP-fucose protein O-fucosyltransferase family protein [Cryptosporidium meleagridis]